MLWSAQRAESKVKNRLEAADDGNEGVGCASRDKGELGGAGKAQGQGAADPRKLGSCRGAREGAGREARRTSRSGNGEEGGEREQRRGEGATTRDGKRRDLDGRRV